MTDDRVVKFFNANDSDADGRIGLEDFLGFYKERALNRPDAVWANLTNAKYGPDLRLSGDQASADDTGIMTDMTVLPRFKLSHYGPFFQELLSVLRSLPITA
jgi:hypothetical protein